MAKVRSTPIVALSVVALTLLSGVAAGSRAIGTNVRQGEDIVGSGRVTFEDGEFFRLRRLICDLTLNVRAIRSLVVKATGGVISEVTSGVTAGCRDTNRDAFNTTILAEPRHAFAMSYVGFLGTLPEITGVLVTIERFAFLLEDPGVFETCLYEGTQGLLFAIARRTVQTGMFLERETAILVFGARECPGSLRVIGTQSFARTITITLLN